MVTDRIRHFLHQTFERGYRPLALALAARGVTANHVSVAGTILQMLCAILVGAGELMWGGIFYILTGTLDTLDGTLARATNTVSIKGAFLDSTLDRLAEGAMFAGIAYYYAAAADPLHAAIAVLVFTVALMVSYMRARAEALGIPASDGLATRGERVFVIGLGLSFGWLAIALYAVGLAAAYTAGQRYVAVARALEGQDRVPRG